jgi:hypothetical protein
VSQAQLGAGSAWAVHPVFSRVRPGSLEPLDQGDVREQWRHLGARVARDPLDLEGHTRRVLLACRAPLTDFAFGALLDLFLVLGPRGQALRARLLATAEGWLEADEAHFLRQALEGGLGRGGALPNAPGSVFHSALVGAAQLVRHERAAAVQLTPHAQAIELLENGDLAGARALLEAALLEEPDDLVLAEELSGIYRALRDDAARTAMGERVLARHGRLPAAWA